MISMVVNPREGLLHLPWDHGWDKTLPVDNLCLFAELLPDHTFMKGIAIYRLWLYVIISVPLPYFAQSQRFFFMWELNPRTQIFKSNQPFPGQLSHDLRSMLLFFFFARALFVFGLSVHIKGFYYIFFYNFYMPTNENTFWLFLITYSARLPHN